MRTFFMTIAFCLAWGMAAQAQESEIRGTIAGQFEAFRADDFDTAFGFATPTLRNLFQTPENFRQMVTKGYGMVLSPAEVTFLELTGKGSTYWQKVLITDPDGSFHMLEYQMMKTEDGWRIAGVRILDQGVSSA